MPRASRNIVPTLTPSKYPTRPDLRWKTSHMPQALRHPADDGVQARTKPPTSDHCSLDLGKVEGSGCYFKVKGLRL